MLAWLVTWFLLIETVHCSHFRGGTASWRYNATADAVEFTRRTFWVNRPGLNCDDDLSTSAFATYQCSGTCVPQQQDYINCTDSSTSLAFVTGERKFAYRVSSRQEGLFSSCCWFDDSAWQFKIVADVTSKLPGVVNTSPVSLQLPVIRIQSGCGQGTISIPVADADGDVVKCRWALSSNQECGDVCQRLPDGSLDKLRCQLDLSSVGVGTYIAALQIEDFSPVNNINTSYSSIPLQFTIEVYTHSGQCADLPYLSSGLSNGSRISIKPNCMWTYTIAASSSSGSRISEIVMASPVGLKTYNLTQIGNSSQWYINVCWTPDATQLGPNIFCYAAVDSLQRMSTTQCLVLYVSADVQFCNSSGRTCSGCSIGYSFASNNETCIDNDECTLGTSGCTQLCNNTVGSYTCSCNTGYKLAEDYHTCNDINECGLGTSGCTQICNNTVGSYTCSCNTGYKLAADNQTCSDINECLLGTSGCTQLCNNTVGSYRCSCNTGYTLAVDNQTCSDINECVLGTSGCTQLCNNTVGSYKCSCNTGYKFAADNQTCSDINECGLGTSGCTQICNNTVGSYTCSCNTGYKLAADNQTCSDINECSLGTSGCTQLCNNTIGSYTCSCNTGYTLHADNQTCNDINECLNGTSGCTQLCNNTVGSYTCSCNTGYKLAADNHTCNDINECTIGTSGCTQLCNNTVGSYKCSCNTGYKLGSDNHTCNDTNECATKNGNCSQQCVNTAGSSTCNCTTGYYLEANGKTCNYINLCASNNGGCSHSCTSVNGTHVICSCMLGYQLDSDSSTCIDINECLNLKACSLQVCTNTNGSYTCFCSLGSILSADMKTCTAYSETLNVVTVTLAGYTVESFTSTVRARFIGTIQDIFNMYCNRSRCTSETNSQYKVAIRSTTNSAAGLVITLQVQTSSSVITAPVVTQALTESNSRLVKDGFIVVSVTPYSDSATKSIPDGIIAAIVVPTVAGAVIVTVVLALLVICCYQSYSKKSKYNIAQAEGLTLMKLEHLVVDNEYATTKNDQFGDEKSIHLSFQKPLTTEAASSTTGTAASSGANEDTTCTAVVTVT